MRDSGDGLAPGTRLEEFAVERELGAGGFGVTYLALDVALGRRVAVKEYLPRDWGARNRDGAVGPRTASCASDYAWGLGRFLEEARALARFDHPHVVRVHRVFEAGGTAYLVTEFVEGPGGGAWSLEDELKSSGPQPEARVRAVLDALISGLELVHASDLVHRDIKPSNVMLRADGSPVLIDFGAARQAVGRQSRSVTSVLTPGYAPIEQYSAKGRQGPWTDVYALGALAYVMLSGRVPDDATERVLEDGLAPLSSVSAHPVSGALSSAVSAALRVDDRSRPQSLGEWRGLLSAASAGEPVASARSGSGPAGSSGRGSSVSSRPRRWAAGGLGGLLGSRRGSDDQSSSTGVDDGAGASVGGPPSVPVPSAGSVLFGGGPGGGVADEGVGGAGAVDGGAAGRWRGFGEVLSRRRSWVYGAGVATVVVCAVAASLGWLGSDRRVSRDEAPVLRVGERFSDCAECPELVVVPAGSFMMGSPSSEEGRYDDEGPQHRVTIPSPLAVGVYEVTFTEWDACVSAGGCGGYRPDAWDGDRGSRPVLDVSWDDAQAYVDWLSRRTGESYRLLSESEWEYVARGGSRTAYWWGGSVGWDRANCVGCGSLWDGEQTAPVGSFGANGFGLHDVSGNVDEWVEDCWHGDYRGAPADGSAMWTPRGDCRLRVLRGGSWLSVPRDLRSAGRSSYSAGNRSGLIGFRVSRTLE